MSFATIMTRGILRTSREIMERNMSVGAVTVSHGQVNVDINHSALCQHYNHHHPQPCTRSRSFSSSATTTTTVPQQLIGHNYFVPSQRRNDGAIISSRRGYHEKSAKKASARRQQDSDSDSDSDDEYERKRLEKHEKHSQRGDSEFWRRKMRTLHRILDVNRDGVISFDDFNLLAKRFTDLGHLTPEAAAELTEIIKQTWEEQFGELSPYNLVTAEKFLSDMQHRLNDKKMAKRIARFLPYFFKAVDFDHTGHLDLDQYKLFFRCLGLSDEDAAISFAVIDKNGDGQLSMKEFVHLGRQFFLTEDETKISKMFWGPLIDH